MRIFILLAMALTSYATAQPRDQSFDSDWRFLRGDAPGAQAPAFNDTTWRKLDVPHDWSIEDLPAAEKVIGPLDPQASPRFPRKRPS